MALNRSDIYSALFARLQTVPGIKTISRKVKMFDQVPPAAQPAIFMVTEGETAKSEKGKPPVWTLSVTVFVYAYNSDPSVGPQVQLATVLDGIEAALEMKDDEVPAPGMTVPVNHSNSFTTTLGGLVSRCDVTSVEHDGGSLGDQGVAVLTLSLLAVG